MNDRFEEVVLKCRDTVAALVLEIFAALASGGFVRMSVTQPGQHQGSL